MFFCKKCKNICFKNDDRYFCNHCKLYQENTGKKNIITINSSKSEENIFLNKTSTVYYDCPNVKCVSKEAKYIVLQTRCSDESPTEYYMCILCNTCTKI